MLTGYYLFFYEMIERDNVEGDVFYADFGLQDNPSTGEGGYLVEAPCAIQVEYELRPYVGGPDPGEDWIVDHGFVTLPAGQDSWFNIPILQSKVDTIEETDEAFSLHIVNIVALDPNVGIATPTFSNIYMSDPEKLRFLASIELVDGLADELGQDTATVRVTLDRPATQSVTVPLHYFQIGTSSGLYPEDTISSLARPSYQNAATGDFTQVPASVTFAVGESQKEFDLTPVDDATVEANEWLDVEVDGRPETFELLDYEVLRGPNWRAAPKVLDNEWRFVNPDPSAFSLSNGTLVGRIDLVDHSGETEYEPITVPSGEYVGFSSIGYSGFNGVEAEAVSQLIGINEAHRNGQMYFSVNPTTGVIARNSGNIVTGSSLQNQVSADIGHAWGPVVDWSANEKRIPVEFELAFGYDVEISTSVGVGIDEINLSFGTSVSTTLKWGVSTAQRTLVVRNRVDDENTGLEPVSP